MGSTRSREASVARLALLALIACAACATDSQVFLHRGHRETFALQLEELKHTQFYVSEDVLAHELGPAGSAELQGPEHVLLLDRGTPGVVTDAGPDWIRVSFDRGPGVRFAANEASKPDSAYLLATGGDNGEPIQRVQDLQDKVVSVAGRRFRIVYGSTARLLVDMGDLEKLIDSRTRARGREAP